MTTNGTMAPYSLYGANSWVNVTAWPMTFNAYNRQRYSTCIHMQYQHASEREDGKACCAFLLTLFMINYHVPILYS